jgi:hypothetical protein
MMMLDEVALYAVYVWQKGKQARLNSLFASSVEAGVWVKKYTDAGWYAESVYTVAATKDESGKINRDFTERLIDDERTHKVRLDQ